MAIEGLSVWCKLCRVLLGLLLIAGIGSTARAGDERGRPRVDLYQMSSLGVGFKSAGIEVMPDGRIAVCNSHALLIYDGFRWREYAHPEDASTQFDLALTPDGRFYGGFPDEIGLFEPLPDGGYRWRSLAEQVPHEERHYPSIISAVFDHNRGAVWIQTGTHLFFHRLDDSGPVSVFKPVGRFSRVFAVGDEIWVHDNGAGLLRATADPPQLAPLSGTAELTRPGPVGIVADDDGALMLLSDGRMMRHVDGALTEFGGGLREALAVASPRTMTRLRDGRLALGFRRDSPWILNADGTLAQRFHPDQGVPDNYTHALAEDDSGGLWVAQDNVVFRVDLASGMSLFDRELDLRLAGSMVRWQNTIYASANAGLYRMRTEPPPARFELVRPELTVVQLLAVSGDDLLVAGIGLQRLRAQADGFPGPAETIATTPQVWGMQVSSFHPETVWLATSLGVVRVDAAGQPQPRQQTIEELPTTLYSIAEEDERTVFVANTGDGLWRLRWDDERVRVLQLDATHGKPDGLIRVVPGREGAWFATTRGLYQWDEAQQRLASPPGLPQRLRKGIVFSMLEDVQGHLWIRGGGDTAVAWRESDGWRWDPTALVQMPATSAVFGFEREDDVLWVLRNDGLLRVETERLAALPPERRPLLAWIGQGGSTAGLPIAGASTLNLSARQRDLSFEYFLPSFVRPETHEYRSRLRGFDADWSEWGKRPERIYTNLPAGKMRFEAQARDSLGRINELEALPLVIAAPWWGTPFAWLFYAGTAALSLLLTARWGAQRRTRVLLRRQRELEVTVADRTAELATQNLQLADQAERLKLADELKTRFFVNVGHEFRTPLTLVMGPLDDVLNDPRTRLGERTREQLELANRNARRVLDLIVELLDVNRIEHGQLPLKRVPSDLAALLRRLAEDSEALVERYGHRIELDIASTPPVVWLDPAQIERVLANLIGNAAKFTPRGGVITVSLACDSESVWIEVRDQGRGIHPNALPHVFDRFYRAEGDVDSVGFGVGLALSREIVERHDGRISVRSEQGVGSCFRIELPIVAQVDSAQVQALASANPTAAPSADPPTLVDQDVGQTDLAEALPLVVAASESRELPLILVADDHPDLRLRLRQLLESRYRVIEAEDGPGALALAHAELPDAIVSDVMMPGFDGVELTRRLRASGDSAAIPILLLTARSGSEHAVVGLQAGANDYLSKPFDASELLARIGALLAQGRRLQLKLTRQPTLELPLPKKAKEEDRWRHKLDQLIEEHLADSGFGVDELAAAMHLDRSALFRRLKSLSAQSPGDYLRERRMQRAHELLLSGAGNVTEVAYSVGFESLSSFSRAIRLRYQCAPSEVIPEQLRAAR